MFKNIAALLAVAVMVGACAATCEHTPLYEPINHCDECLWERD